jgi:hypothetical protein
LNVATSVGCLLCLGGFGWAKRVFFSLSGVRFVLLLVDVATQFITICIWNPKCGPSFLRLAQGIKELAALSILGAHLQNTLEKPLIDAAAKEIMNGHRVRDTRWQLLAWKAAIAPRNLLVVATITNI